MLDTAMRTRANGDSKLAEIARHWLALVRWRVDQRQLPHLNDHLACDMGLDRAEVDRAQLTLPSQQHHPML